MMCSDIVQSPGDTVDEKQREKPVMMQSNTVQLSLAPAKINFVVVTNTKLRLSR